MKLKEKIALALQKELEPLGYHYFKSTGYFKKKIDKNTFVSISYDPVCSRGGITEIYLRAEGEYRDIEKVLYKLTNSNVQRDGHLGIVCMLQWLLPEDFWDVAPDFRFRNDDGEETYNKKLEKLIWRTKTYLLPYLERLSNRDGALKETIALDSKCLIFREYIAPVMYCVWKHDKKAALDYLEARRKLLLGHVKPEEWGRLERMKKGEFLGVLRPHHAIYYEEYVEDSKKIREWIESQEYYD